ncbi:MAG TPA: nuclear transport factor 2 family protein [Candidatus Binataceae bacterium]|nr:nuclear transport factor 2 family protein [Candidatus Binataceae bacterium]
MPTVQEMVLELVDREAIRELGSRYCDYVWQRKLEELVDLFADDGAFRVEGIEVEAVARGHAQLRRVYEKAFSELGARLLLHNQIIEKPAASRATGRCYVEVYSDKRGETRIGSGYYDDEYVKVGDKWKFASRRYFLDAIDSTVWLRQFIV